MTIRRDTTHFERERGVTEVRVERAVSHITVRLPLDRIAGERLDLLQRLAAENIPVFLVKLLPAGISFAVRGDNVARCTDLLAERQADYALLPDLAVVSTLAGAMRDLSGVMAGIYEALIGAGVRVRQTGDAYNAVHCLVDGNLADGAAAALENRFGLNGEAAPPTSETDTEIDTAMSGGLKAL